MQSNAFDSSVKRAPTSLLLFTDSLNFSNMTSRQCCVLCPLRETHALGDSMSSKSIKLVID